MHLRLVFRVVRFHRRMSSHPVLHVIVAAYLDFDQEGRVLSDLESRMCVLHFLSGLRKVLKDSVVSIDRRAVVPFRSILGIARLEGFLAVAQSFAEGYSGWLENADSV